MTLRDSFVAGMGQLACTVNVVTTDGPAGRAGITVSATASVSADGERPALLACVHSGSPAARMILENRGFCVNVLQDDHAWLSDIFAGGGSPACFADVRRCQGGIGRRIILIAAQES